MEKGKTRDRGRGGDREDHHKSVGLEKCWSQKATYRGKSCPIYQCRGGRDSRDRFGSDSCRIWTVQHGQELWAYSLHLTRTHSVAAAEASLAGG
eukprot:SAG25_NODE_6098_length_588_cov_0.891616_1_plen_93_part_10